MKKKDSLSIVILLIFLIVILLLLTRFRYWYGSVVDWNTQHYNIPDYFRKLFYETGDILPNFAFNLGNGQNIFYLSYYGLFSPIIMFSYLFPFVSMRSYIIISVILSIIFSVIFIYYWFREKFSVSVSLVSTLLFMLSSSFIFHSHRHIMFMNYMPFLILAYKGVNLYFEKGKKCFLVFSIFLMIMTSYYFSVSGIVGLVIYGIYVWLSDNKKVCWKSFWKDGIKFLGLFLVAILMAGLLLIPTIYTILEGRSVSGILEFSDLFKVCNDLGKVFYGSYSTGLSAILLVSLVGIYLFGEKGDKFLAIVLVMILFSSIILFLLNGMMYLDGKVLIAFLPLFCLVIGKFLIIVMDRVIDLKKMFLLILIVVLWIILGNLGNGKVLLFFIVDVIVTMFLLWLVRKTEKDLILYIYLVGLSFVICLVVNVNDELVMLNDEVDYSLVEEYIDGNFSIFRTNYLVDNLDNINKVGNLIYSSSIYSSISNSYYKDFYNNLINNEFSYRSREILSTTNNVLSNIYFGNRYVVALDYDGIGYDRVLCSSGCLYENDNVYAIGYATNRVMSVREYNSLSYPYNVDALMRYTIVDKEIDDVYDRKIEKIDLEMKVISSEVVVSNREDGYLVESTGGRVRLNIDNYSLLRDKIILIKFMVMNKVDYDRFITINGVKNKVSEEGWKYHNGNYEFNYTLSSNTDIEYLDIYFSEGVFEIDDIEVYGLDYKEVLKTSLGHSNLVLDKELTKGDVIVGKIDVNEDGYFSMSIPYDDGFSIYVDGDLVEYEKVNVDFIGFPISGGSHEIKIIYKALYFDLGKMISIVGFLVFVWLFFRDRKMVQLNSK